MMPDRRSPLFGFMRKLHKWLGLIIGLQLLVWLSSGLVMTIIDQQVAGGFTSRADAEPNIPLSQYGALHSPQTLDLPHPQITELRLASLLGRAVYRVKQADQVLLFDATTGLAISIDAQRARQIATASYTGEGKPVGQQWLGQGTEVLSDFHGPLWRVDFDDSLKTWVFIDGLDGRVVAHYNDRGGLMDFLLMLHFMDYLQDDSFNNPQIIVVGFSALWLSISGLSLLLVSFNRRDVSWLRRH